MKEALLIAAGIGIGWWVCSTKNNNKALKEELASLKARENK